MLLIYIGTDLVISGQRYDKILLISLFGGSFLTGRGEEVGEEEGGIG